MYFQRVYPRGSHKNAKVVSYADYKSTKERRGEPHQSYATICALKCHNY